jgi:hypothetical protein
LVGHAAWRLSPPSEDVSIPQVVVDPIIGSASTVLGVTTAGGTLFCQLIRSRTIAGRGDVVRRAGVLRSCFPLGDRWLWDDALDIT